MHAVKLLLDSSLGIYIPQAFAEQFLFIQRDGRGWRHVSNDDLATLRVGPDHEQYWDTWRDVLDNAQADIDGHAHVLYQDDDLFALCPERMTTEQKRNFGFDA